jgi:hypothetical protein
MAKTYKRVARTHAIRPERWPLDKKSIKVTTAPVRLDRDVRQQNRTGLGNPYR